jgi:hypothetical protein
MYSHQTRDAYPAPVCVNAHAHARVECLHQAVGVEQWQDGHIVPNSDVELAGEADLIAFDRCCKLEAISSDPYGRTTNDSGSN